MTPTREEQDDHAEEWGYEELEGLPEEADYGGIHETNTPFPGEAMDAIQDSAENGERVQINIYDGEAGVMYSAFNGGIGADYLLGQLEESGQSLAEYIASNSGLDINADNITFYQIHSSDDSSLMRFDWSDEK